MLFDSGPDQPRTGYRGPLGRRLVGASTALRDCGLSLDSAGISLVEATCARAGGYSATLELMNEPGPPTAVIVLSDIMAVGALDALQSLGIQVPAQVSVAGCDDQPEAEWTRPKLTTVRQPTEAKGRLAGDFLDAIRGEDQHPRQRLQWTLVIRDSTGAAPIS